MILFFCCLMVLLYIFCEVSRRYFRKQFVIEVFIFALLIVLCCYITYTPDKAGYEYWLLSGRKGEILFDFLRKLIIQYGLSYNELDLFYVSIYSILLIRFVNYFKHNMLLIILLFLMINYVFYATQIRYFLGYFLALHAFYSFFELRKKREGFIYFLLGCLSHTSIILFLPFYFLYKLDYKILAKWVIITSLFSFFVFLVLFLFFNSLLAIEFNKYSNYLDSDLVSSFWGGVYFFAPAIIIMIFLHHFFIKYEIFDSQSIFLYKMSLIPYIYIGIAFYLQVIGHRFIISAFLLQLLLAFNILNFKSSKRLITPQLLLFGFSLIYFLYFYFIPIVFVGHSGLWNALVKMFMSNTLLNS